MLEEVRVLDFTPTLTGLFCCMLLTEMGAEVIQVEPTQKEKGSLKTFSRIFQEL